MLMQCPVCWRSTKLDDAIFLAVRPLLRLYRHLLSVEIGGHWRLRGNTMNARYLELPGRPSPTPVILLISGCASMWPEQADTCCQPRGLRCSVCGGNLGNRSLDSGLASTSACFRMLWQQRAIGNVAA